MNLEDAAGSLFLSQTHQVKGPEVFSRHTGGNKEDPHLVPFPCQSLCRKNGRSGAFTFYSIYSNSSLGLSIKLHCSYNYTTSGGGDVKTD